MNDHLGSDRHRLVGDISADNIHLPGNRQRFSVKTEDTASPNLPPASLHHFEFQFRSQLPHTQGNNITNSNATSSASPVYRFGSDVSTFDTLSHPSWPSSSTSSQHQSSSAGHMTEEELSQKHNLHIATMQHTMSFNDEYDDADELTDLPGGISGVAGLGQSGSGQMSEKAIRRRSSKACDQCRKSKCKCERTGDGEACRSCVMLGTPCTFLGPSRKRGPPKGYIDAIEARLHQTEALLGIMIASGDERAKTLLDDLKHDSLAHEIINRVDNSPYGSKGRKKGAEAPGGTKSRPGTSGSTSPVQSAPPKTKADQPQAEFTSTHPSNEWQDRVSTMLRTTAYSRGVTHPVDASDSLLALRYAHPGDPSTEQAAHPASGERPILRVAPTASLQSGKSSHSSPLRRQRRRLEGDQMLSPPSEPSSAVSRPSASRDPLFPLNLARSMTSLTSQLNTALNTRRPRRSTSPADSISSASEEGLTDAVGQLSLNEDEQVRYHGKVSGLHLLGHKERVDGRNEGGIWRLPKARVWPPLPSDMREKSRLSAMSATEDEYTSQLPDAATQEHLLELYFTYVHPAIPVVHKKAFCDVFRAGDTGPESPGSSTSDAASASGSPFNRRRRRIPTLLLLAMFAISARYSNTFTLPPPTDGSMMWAAGDSYLDSAKVILDGSYGSSRASTCQALLLMGYREVGIGAMAQAWIYIGMAVRMAQDLGMHRSADGWARVGLGGRLFSEPELQERKRIWYTCVIMDTYVSTYIGRPLAIFERDFDTLLPSEDDAEEIELWQPHSSPDQQGIDHWERSPSTQVVPFIPVPGRVISCFNSSARLSGLLSTIIQTIYATRPPASRHEGREYLESLLDKWYFELPEHLRHEPGSAKSPAPLPTVLTLHMQYWCTVLLLHRPFIGYLGGVRQKPSHIASPQDSEDRKSAKKSYELCAGAANHITSIVSTYIEHYCIRRAAVFLCYYVFTASIMHITTLTTYPSDPQARMGLRTCMDALQRMEIVWPSAARALDLLRGSKVNLEESELATLSNHPDRNKRSAEHPIDTEDVFERSHLQTSGPSDYLSMRSHHFGASSYHVGQEGYADNMGLQPGTTGSANPPYFSAYERWAAENSEPIQYPNTLSTSVLPQLYSTGLVDDRTSIGITNRNQSSVEVHHNGHNHTRYPQYWNDYSTFPQLGTAYGMPDPVQPSHPSSTTPQTQAPNIYMPEHYNVYNNHPPNS